MTGKSGHTAQPQAPSSGQTLKDQNRLPLLMVLGLNLLILVLVIKTGQLVVPDDVEGLARQWRDLVPAGVGVVFAGVVNGLLDSNTKARLVFWRWSDPLPGSFAFSRYMHRDPRVDLKALRKALGRLPIKPREQNALWYRLFKSVEREPTVVDAHRQFLLTRDYAAVAFLLLLSAAPHSEQLRSLKLPLPSLVEQHEIVRHIRSAFSQIASVAGNAERTEELLDRLDQAILEKAFSGELTISDPTEEKVLEFVG